ncbi:MULTISPECIES: hypothetical protein [Sphingobacterium]|uniref:hypothetical protein n=1 Tax=Sphingobacterium TaxID=28453 RepID=UPI0010E9D92A|nr:MULTISPECIES: hypothetical protein [Sphingobacterium]MCW2264042.1 hypothetical protein [Sphingobacterium kitahiroshimense]TCR14972.1 hypothetical protein EDF67_1011079 [Sphingobacterium sp. JUb78]
MGEKNRVKSRYTKVTKMEVVDAIMDGELWIEEAMVKYNIEDRMLIITWLRKYIRDTR